MTRDETEEREIGLLPQQKKKQPRPKGERGLYKGTRFKKKFKKRGCFEKKGGPKDEGSKIILSEIKGGKKKERWQSKK